MDACTRLYRELEWYHSVCNKLKELVEETSALFEEVDRSTPSATAHLSPDAFVEEADVRSILRKRPTVVVLGQSNSAKAQLVNQILNDEVLPVSVKHGAKWRPVKISQGLQRTLSVSLPDSFELISTLHPAAKTVPEEDLEAPESGPGDRCAGGPQSVLEVTVNSVALKSELVVLVLPRTEKDLFAQFADSSLPIVAYAVDGWCLSEEDASELAAFREAHGSCPILFVHLGSAANRRQLHGSTGRAVPLDLFEQLCKIGYLSMLPSDGHGRGGSGGSSVWDRSFSAARGGESGGGGGAVHSELVERASDVAEALQAFTHDCLQGSLVAACVLLGAAHQRCLERFIVYAFEMQRDMLITPKRLDFARTREQELFATLTDLTVLKQEEISDLVATSIASTRDTIMSCLADYDFIGVNINADGQLMSAKDLKVCTGQIRELVLGKLNEAVAGKLAESVNVLRDSFIGTLTRCLESLEASDTSGSGKEGHEGRSAVGALKQILNMAYLLDVNVGCGPSLLQSFFNRMKQLIRSLPWNRPPIIDTAWKQAVAAEMLNSLSEHRLARSICEQIKDRLRHSHDAFGAALRALEQRHETRLERTEGARLRLRKFLSPSVARLALQSSSLKDSVVYGMPQCGKEIGRGQYGVVYACDEWAGYGNCAIKSVAPPDDKHWNDLALEFFYAKNLPEHERIVGVRGSVIDYNYGDGRSPAVLIIMDRLQRDFHSGIKSGLDWPSRLQVSIDVVEGIRFLHRQGLVHRDIKLKNVLLNKENRGLLTDLGFCMSEAMLSGTIVGTPIHMAPELFTGQYDHTVDVYAFGILFWYVCAGHVNLPYNFNICDNKDQLWTSVQKGVRPERLSVFDEECWRLMQECWDSDPAKRPLLGDVECQLTQILGRVRRVYGQQQRTAADSTDPRLRLTCIANI